MKRALHVVLVFLAIAGGGSRADADRIGAEALYAMAQQQREKADLPAAEATLRKAVAEDDTFLPARLALGEALLARGSLEDGLVELKAAGTLAAESGALSAWPAETARARKRSQELDATSAAIAAKVQKHVTDTLALAGRWLEKDPDLARGALERVLRLVPDHPEATTLLAGLGSAAPVVDSTPLFQSQEGAEWVGLKDGWTIQDGLVSAASGREGGGFWTREFYSGDFDFRAEVRLIESLGDPKILGLIALHGPGDLTTFGFADGRFIWQEGTPTDAKFSFEGELSALRLTFDPAQWNTLEMRFRGPKAEAWVNGRRIAEVARRNPDQPTAMGLRFQQGRVEYRKAELRRP